MALLVELSPRLVIKFVNGEPSREVKLRSGELNNILNKYVDDYSIYLAAGGNIGREIYNILKTSGSKIKHIDIKDGAKIDVEIREEQLCKCFSEKIHRLTFDDVNNIKREFISALLNEDVVLLPVFDIEKEFALEFLRKTSDYHKKSVVFGDYSLNTLSENPTVVIISEEQVIDYAPFKIVSEYELVNFSYSFTEGRKSKVLVAGKSGLNFFDGDECIKFDTEEYNMEMVMFAYLFAIENNMPEEEWPRFVSAASQSISGTKVGDMVALSKKIKLSVLHR